MTLSKFETSNVPQIRFRGHEQDWEEKAIGAILSEVKRSIVLEDNRQYELITVRRRNEGIVSRGHLFGRDILVKNYSQLKSGDYVISKRQVVHGATGRINAHLNNAIVSNEYLVATDSKDISTEFLTILSSLPKMKQKFFLSSYGVDIEKLFFDVVDWKKRTVTIPKKPEQEKISLLFRGLNQLLNKHQEKHDKLVALKQAMLQKMFPQPGTTAPEIRFKDFEGHWVESALKTSAEITTGFPFKSSDFSESGTYLVVTNGNIQNETAFVDSSCGSRISIQNLSGLNQFILQVGDILVTMDGSVGRTAKVRETNQILAQRVGRLVAKLDSEFLYQSLNTGAFLKEMTTISHGGTIKHISLSEIGDYIFLAPCDLEEQKIIGRYFHQLDELIFRHATHLEKLKQVKAACLEKMFV